MWLMIASGLFGLSVVMALAEVFGEWDAEQWIQYRSHNPSTPTDGPYRWQSLEGLEWPSTGRYVLIFGAILLMSLFQ